MRTLHLMFVAAPVLVTLVVGGCDSSTKTNNNNDAGTNDAGTNDAGTNDAGTISCTDMTGSATPTVGILTMNGGAYGDTTYAYNPTCVLINKGQSVTFTGDYSLHSLERTTQTVATAVNPLPSTPYSGSSPVTFGPFPDSGDFNFYCPIHSFAGTIRVNP